MQSTPYGTAMLLASRLLLLTTLTAGSAAAQALDSCSVSKYAELIEEWKRLTSSEMLGAEGVDAGTVGVEGIAMRPFFLGGKTWFPVSSERQTVCGTFDDSKVFDFAEYDWNIFLKPGPGFTWVIDLTELPRKNGLNIENCPGDTTAPCLEVEVGARKDYFQHQHFNKFLPKALGASVLRKGPVCVSGPWVQDDNHSQHPEIHPAEQIWWRFPGSTGPLHLMVAQDASARFAQRDDFAFDSAPSPQFRVWSARPVPSRFTVAFSTPATGTTSYDLEELERQDVVELAANDTGNLTVRDGADVRLTVRKPAGANRRLMLGLDWACRMDDRVIGTVAVNSSVGNPSNSNPGFYLLRMTPGGPPAMTPPAPQAAAAAKPPEVDVDVVPNTLRRAIVDGKPSLVADIVLSPPAGAGNAGTVKSVRMTKPAVRALAGQPSSTPGGTLLKEVPVGASASSLDVELASGQPARVQLPPIGMKARLADALPLEKTPGGPAAIAADAAAIAAFARVTGLWEGSKPSFGRVMRTQGWKVEVAPVYGIIKDGRVATDESSPLTADLGAATEKEGPTRQRVFGTQTPFVATWKVAARDLSEDAANIPVSATRAPGSAQVALAPSPHTGKDGMATISAPPDTTRLVQLDATVSVSDVYGLSDTTSTTLWNHYLSGDPKDLHEGLMAAVARRNDLSPGMLADPGQRTADRDKRRRVDSLRTLVKLVADDERITIDEARQVMDYARDNAPALRKQ